MTEEIKGYVFQLTKPVYLKSPKNKFWEVSMNGSEARYRAGVLRNNEEFKIIEVTKDYDSNALAKGKIITKIAEKIDKKYYSTTSIKIEQKPSENKPVARRKIQKQQQTCDQTEQTKKKTRRRKSQTTTANKEGHKTLWKGFEKGQQKIEFHVRGNQVQTTRKCGQQQSNQSKVYPNYDKAVGFVHKKEAELLKEGYKACVSEAYINQEATARRKPGSTAANPFRDGKSDKSLTIMTDNAMQIHSSVQVADEGVRLYIPNIRLGPPTDQCIKCLLAQNYKEGTDPTGWIMSQKLDGVRCLWTGTQMYSRNGNKFSFPNFFTKNWPRSQLDGELFIGRGKFSQTLSAVKKNIPISAEWQNLRYLVFDAPGVKQPFKNRIKVLQEQLAKVDNPYLKCHAHRPCKGFADLFEELDEVNKIGGQGIMLREPQAYYENKRSKNLQKVKTFHDDEADIIGYTEGTGRCQGWVGALRVRNNKGVEFEVGSGLNDYLRQNPPAIGTKITYKYQQFNKQSGKPRFPTFLRVYIPL